MPRAIGNVEQYLERYAEPEAQIARAVKDAYGYVLVVPACREAPGFWERYVTAARSAAARVLAIIVVNGAEHAKAEVHDANQRLVTALLESMSSVQKLAEAPPAWLGNAGVMDLLVIDRQRPDFRFPPKVGVGLARRIGCDVALALHAAGKLRSNFIACTDADAELGADYFAALNALPEAAVAAHFPFMHVSSGDSEVDRATALYELGLHYYVLGLRSAGSPYAFHSIGSCLAIRQDAYAAVRGFPKREAAEDFYLLDKAVKLGPLARPMAEPVRIRARLSDRVPFGTGRAVSSIHGRALQDSEFTLYDPITFDVLGRIIECIRQFSIERSWVNACRAFEHCRVPAAAFRACLASSGLEQALVAASRQAKTERELLRRAHIWFDGFRTLKLVHRIRAVLAPQIDWQTALAAAPFCGSSAGVSGLAPAFVVEQLAGLVAQQPGLLGPTCIAGYTGDDLM